MAQSAKARGGAGAGLNTSSIPVDEAKAQAGFDSLHVRLIPDEYILYD